MKTARLILDNGMIFEGTSIGADTTMFGELVFNTSMTGYQEILSDPSYASQVVVLTYPEIGNTGINEFDFEGNGTFARGIVVKNYCENESHYLSEKTLKDFLIEKGIAGISGIDTRNLTKILRLAQTVNCVITTEQVTDKLIDELSRYKTGKDLVLYVSRKDVEYFENLSNSDDVVNAAMIDFGVTNSLINDMRKQGFNLTIYPADVDAETILNKNFDAVFLSNGPGNPVDCVEQIETIKKFVGKLPIFGIGLGYQLLGIANGATTFKLPQGHRGSNHPVKDSRTGKVILTNQNHGYAIEPNWENSKIFITHKNLNDESIEGFESESLKIFGLQYQPQTFTSNGSTPVLKEWFLKILSFKKAQTTTDTTILVSTEVK